MTPHFIELRLHVLDALFKTELDFLKNPPKREGGSPPQILQIPFKKFVNSPDVVVKEMFALLGVEYEGDKYLEDIVQKILQKNKSYKRLRKYKNPELEFFGLNKEEL